MKKHLIHIGYPKAASTYLQEWFRQNPQICYEPNGLAGFYDVFGIVRQAAQSETDNLKCYVTSTEYLSVPQTDAGAISTQKGKAVLDHQFSLIEAQTNCCAVLKDLFPDGKILVITRGFRKKIFSGFSQTIKQGSLLTFEQTFLNSVFPIKEGLEQLYNIFEINHLVEMYFKSFGKDNVIVLPFELLQDDKRRFFEIIENEMDLQPFDGEIPKLNESLSPEELYWYPRISNRVSRFAHLFGNNGYEKIYRWYVSKTLENKLSGIVKILNRLKPGRRVVEADLPEEIFQHCRDFATILKDNPLYQPYLKEYLLDE